MTFYFSIQNLPGTPHIAALQRKPTCVYKPPLFEPQLPAPAPLPARSPLHPMSSLPPKIAGPWAFCSSRENKTRELPRSSKKALKTRWWCMGNSYWGEETQCPRRGGSGAPYFSLSPQQTLGLGQGSPVPRGSAACAGRLGASTPGKWQTPVVWGRMGADPVGFVP